MEQVQAWIVCLFLLSSLLSLSKIFSFIITKVIYQIVLKHRGFPGGSVVKNPPTNTGDMGSIPGSGRSPREENINPLQYSCLENPMDRGDWQATVHVVATSRTQLSDWVRTQALKYWQEKQQSLSSGPILSNLPAQFIRDSHYLFSLLFHQRVTFLLPNNCTLLLLSLLILDISFLLL